MKARILGLTILLFTGSLHSIGQVVANPLVDYFHSFAADANSNGDKETPSLDTKIYCFEANFTKSERKSVFLTADSEYLGGHGKYAWSVYCPTNNGGYRSITDGSDFLPSSLYGPDFIGYIKEIKMYGAIIGNKYSVDAYYLDKGIINGKAIDTQDAHANGTFYPKYFPSHFPDYHIQVYTLGQLIRKFGKP